MEAILCNRNQPEFGCVTIPLPIPDEEYGKCIKLLEALEIGSVTGHDCYVDQITDAPPSLDMLEGTMINVDELDFLARSLDRYTDEELAKFQCMTATREHWDMQTLINLSFSCEQATVITDFSKLEEAGRSHYMTMHGGGVPVEEYNQLNGVGIARSLIADGGGRITPYGVVFENAMRIEPVYDGHSFPPYSDKPYLMDNEMILTFFFSQAQAESESLSKNVSWGHRRNYENGKVYYQYDSFLGYKKGPDGQPEIDEGQAPIVRRIFARYLMGDSVRKICRDLEADGIRTVRGCEKWSDSTVQNMLRNEKYIGDALLQKTYIQDIFTRKSMKNLGQLPKYYVHNCHPAIIDRTTFQKVQEEIARRSSKKKTSAKAKTELGKYSGKYALSELLVCGECGSPYRRQTYMPKGEKYHVWRCLNRLENGTRICKHSPTFLETDIHDAIVAAMNEQLVRQRAKDELKQSMYTALAAAEPEMTLPAVESKIKALRDRQVELIGLATAEGAKFEDYDQEISRVNEERLRLLGIRAELEMAQQTNSAFDQRMEEIDAALSQDSGMIEKYDDIRTRQLISNIKVLDKERLLIRFRDGTESVQTV